MAKSGALKMKLPSVDDLFSTEESRQEAKLTRTYLYITVTHKSSDEMAAQYGFTDEQKAQLTELLSEENKKLWSGVLYGYTTGSEDLVNVALSQIGNAGGEPYLSLIHI